MLRFLTQKLKSQSLNEVQPVQVTQELEGGVGNNTMKVENLEDHDSGTESDDENAELQQIEEGLAQGRQQGTDAHAPTLSQRSPTFSNSMTNRRSSPTLVSVPTLVSPLEGDELHDQSSMDSGCLPNEVLSSHCSSDFERCSLDYEPSSSVELSRHSSEEELDTIIQRPTSGAGAAEKRTWSQANAGHGGGDWCAPRCASCADNLSGTSSSDEEVRDLLTAPAPPRPLAFRASPPPGVQRLGPALPPKLFLANVTPANHCTAPSPRTPTNHVCTAASPRKRHRHHLVAQRPCLDFEKMQKTLLRRQMAGLSRARIVKIKSFNGSNRPPKLMCDPAVFTFRSISMAYTPLTPVEEPSVAF